MEAPSFSEFEAAARREGYDEVVPRDWPAGAVLETHEHPFAVKAIVVAGPGSSAWVRLLSPVMRPRRIGGVSLFDLRGHGSRACGRSG